MRVADEQDLHIREFEAELFDAVSNQWNGLYKAAVDDDVALRRGDEIRRQIL